MATATIEEIYEQIEELPVEQRLRLVERIVHDLAANSVEFKANGEVPRPLSPEQVARLAKSRTPGRRSWREIRGVAPNLLCGEDAQEWVSRTRREDTEHREKQWGREP
jgi:hypothetical protein